MQSMEENAGMHLLPPSVSIVGGAYTGNNSYFTGAGHLGFLNKAVLDTLALRAMAT